jgi:hypothetical protein
MMMTNWMPTLAGFLAALGPLLVVIDPSLRIVGGVIGAVGVALLGIVSKQYNVHGGTVPQATPPKVQAETLKEGVALACKEDSSECKK